MSDVNLTVPHVPILTLTAEDIANLNQWYNDEHGAQTWIACKESELRTFVYNLTKVMEWAARRPDDEDARKFRSAFSRLLSAIELDRADL